MTEPAWTSLGVENSFSSKESLIRAWIPGDGIVCSTATLQRRVPCGKPVAVIQTIDPRGNFNSYKKQWETKLINRVVCAHHLAGRWALDPGQARLKAEKESREKVLTSHWDEYQKEYEARLKSTRKDQLAAIPASVRKLLGRIDWDNVEYESGDDS